MATNTQEISRIIYKYLNDNVNQATLAKKIGVNRSVITRAMNEGSLKYANAVAMCNVLDMDIRDQVEFLEAANYPLPDKIAEYLKVPDNNHPPGEMEQLTQRINECYQSWRDLDYAFRDSRLIREDEFNTITKFSKMYLNIGNVKLAYLFCCAVQYGMHGHWGTWLKLNRTNPEIVIPLLHNLTEVNGRRPLWRSAYILEVIFGKELPRVTEIHCPTLFKRSDVRNIIDIIQGRGTVSHLEQIAQMPNDGMKKIATVVLQEIKVYKEDAESVHYNNTVGKQFIETT